MSHWYEDYKVDIPACRNDSWAVEKFIVPEKSIEGMRLAFQGRSIFPGQYTKLVRLNGSSFGGPVMSDTPAEIEDHFKLFSKAKGRILINGLGLGMALRGILLKPEVKHVDVVEISQSLIDLIGPHYLADSRVSIYCSDAYTWKPPVGVRWDVVWHDIWDNICTDNLKGMTKLHRKYGRRCDWQGSWAQWECKRALREERRSMRGWF